jgi:hypothetical protein
VAISHFVDGRASAALVTWRSTSRHATFSTALAVKLHHDWVADAFQLLLLGIIVGTYSSFSANCVQWFAAGAGVF